MSFCTRGLSAKLKRTSIKITISSTDPLIRLGNALNWSKIAEIAFPDLKQTAKGFWYLGCRLCLRAHLSVMVLQTLLKKPTAV